uniref:Shavenoid isoform B-like N-terminal domain-containing protein n=2 Tax=Wuchereria bancrofti TaxID=6293 RepID=A0AAF5PV52_WUCBA
MIIVISLFLDLLIVNILNRKYLGTYAYPSYPLGHPENDWISVHRHLNAPDIIHFTKCSSPIATCSTILDSSIVPDQDSGSVTRQQCSCQCKADAAIFLPSTRSCINKLDECRQQIPFQSINDKAKRWLPTFSVPATNSIFAPSHIILWNEVIERRKDIAEGELKCFVKDTFVQSDNLWILRNDSKLFKLENYNYTNYLIWTGSETDAKKMEGNIIQLKIFCNNAISELYCIAFRIAGIHVNANLTHRFNDMQWNRIELIICVLLTTLLGITLFGGIALWKVCWKKEKSKLVSTMQMQFLYHMKQQQVYMQEQIASIKASIERHPTFENETDQCPTNVGMQKRKLYFSADFFEPELMANPPVLAVQFVYELRKMIDIAKDRIRMKRHVPTLTTISEDSENDEYLEIPRPPSRMNERIDELSPKSLNSVDSGCDSMSDEDVQNQKVLAQDQEQGSEQIRKTDKSGKWNENELERKRKESENIQSNSCHQKVRQCTIIPNKVDNLMPRSVTKVVQISRIPATSSSRVTLVTTTQRLNPKPFLSTDLSKTIYDRQNGANALMENAISSTASKLPNLVSIKREPPNLKRILNNVPPPLPETTPPSTPPPCRNRLYSGRRKAYAVFPNSDLMLKKSLPRRSKRQQRFGTATAVAVQTTLSLSPAPPVSSSVLQSSPQSSSSSLSSSSSSSSTSSSLSCVSSTT